MSDAKAAEQLWLKAHEEVKKGNLAQAVRDLAKCYEGLKALRDPRLAQVHRRWVEVHKLYQARKAKAAAAQATQPAAVQAQAAAEAKRRAEADARQRAEAEARQRAVAEAVATQRRAEEEKAAAAAAAAAAANQPAINVERTAAADAATIEQEAEAAANAGDLAQATALYERVVAAQPGNELAAERLAELRAAEKHAQTYSQPPRAASGGADPADQVAFLEGLLGRIEERRRAV